MQFNIKTALSLLLSALLFSAFSALAADKKIYTENEFLDTFGGKTQKVFLEQLGKPTQKQQSVKPSGSQAILAKAGAGKQDKSKKVKIEMWYYGDIVTYDGKRTYKEVEVTFVNTIAGNIAFFNNR